MKPMPWRQQLAVHIRPPMTRLEHEVMAEYLAAKKYFEAATRQLQRHCAHHSMSTPDMKCSACCAIRPKELDCECGKARPEGLSVCWWCYAKQNPSEVLCSG